MLPKILIVFVLIMIVASLGTALVYLLKDRNRSPRTVKALTARIGMSIALFFLLLIGFQTGILHPHGLNPVSGQSGVAQSAP
ncbi:twin transmembrane helix small protein [Methylococcus sp. EFPC2]|uniref:twin transmembrane helix small protein n=1 Tax=Methylococcus sp. EFPC2 TaxID=2812648 RepID=UPI001967B27A|nr:twin transmembrane helix small protein [Methylococcus sp. EFPC2]QSA95883.1 twin transmembrane helix small protein [Methylococcus sp. EFPC2]